MTLEILALHMLGDYILQTDEMATKKLSDARVRLAHVIAYIVPFLVWFAFENDMAGVWFALAVGVTHFIIDSHRFCADHPWPPKSILIDQSLHIITLAVLARLFL